MHRGEMLLALFLLPLFVGLAITLIERIELYLTRLWRKR
jgi:hypothetical protein